MSKIRISYEDLKSEKVEKVLNRQAEESALRRGVGTASEERGYVSLIHKSWFNLMIAGMVGALIAWAFIEPYFDDFAREDDPQSILVGYLWFPLAGALVGLLIGAMEGFLARNYNRAAIGGAVGLGIGFGGGCLTTILASIVMTATGLVGFIIVGQEAASNPTNYISGFLIILIARSLAWTIAGMSVGLGPGIALKSKKLVLNGFLGGMLGGFLGGFLFDPINYLVSGGTMNHGAELSRAIGFAVIGAAAGFMIGMVEMLTKDAWLVMNEGPLTGKQFILYKNQTFIGSSPKCEVYLFKDPDIEPFHGVITKIRDGYDIEDRDSQKGILVNNIPIKRKRLEKGDEVQIGNFKFVYSEKEHKK